MGRVVGDERSGPERPYRRLLVPLLTVALALGACGGGSEGTSAGDGGDQVADGGAGAGTGGTDPAADPAGSDDADSDAGSSRGEAVVEIGGERWMFAMDLGCAQNFGSVAGGGTATDGSGAQLEVLIPPENYESTPEENWAPPRVRVVLADGSSWTAASHEGQGSVSSFDNDGERASGRGTFRHDSGETSEGSFEFSCP